MSTLATPISLFVEEQLSGGVQESLPGLDSLFQEIVTNWFKVMSQGIGRNWTVIHTFREGVGGAIKWVDPAGDSISSDIDRTVQLGSTPRGYQGITEVSIPDHFQKQIVLSEAMGNFFIPFKYIWASQLDAAIADAVMELVQSVQENVANSEIAAFYSVDAFGSIARVATSPTAPADPSYEIEVYFGSVNAFRSGMRVDLIDATDGTTVLNTGTVSGLVIPLVVNGVDYMAEETDTEGCGGRITLTLGDGTNWDDADLTGLAVGDYIVPHASNTYTPGGPETWLVGDGDTSDPFGIEVDVYEQMKSLVVASVGALDDALLRKYLARFTKAYGKPKMPDTLVSSYGVLLDYLLNVTHASDGSANLGSVNRPYDQPLKTGQGMEGTPHKFYFDGKMLDWHTSTFFPSASVDVSGTPSGGRLWGMKVKNGGILRYVPPKMGHSQTKDGFGREIEFVFPVGGPMGIFFPALNSDVALTQHMQAPFNRHLAWCPKQMQGIKLTDVQEVL